MNSNMTFEEKQNVAGDAEILITRVFDAPRKLVFEAWSKPEHLSRWFAPAGLTLPVCEMDFRSGGVFKIVMHAPDGTDYPTGGTFGEIVIPEKITWTWFLHHLKPAIEVPTTTLFEDLGGKTRITVRQRYLKSATPPGAREGWTSTLDNLAIVIAGMAREGK